MIEVILKPINQGPYIYAPEHCPFQQSEVIAEEGVLGSIVNSSLCPLCKMCKFITNESFTTTELEEDEKKQIAQYLINFNSKVASSISGQNLYLNKEDRCIVAVLISADLFEQVLQYLKVSEERKKQIRYKIIYSETSICHILGCPVYVATKLTKVPVQVVGEISWKI